MDRIDDPTAEQNKFGAGKDGWTNGDPTDPNSGTIGQEEWFDGVQEELLNIIETAGLTPAALDFTQVLDGLEILYLRRSGTSNEMDIAIPFGAAFAGDSPRITDTNATTDSRTHWLKAAAITGNFVNVYTEPAGLSVAFNAEWNQGTTQWDSLGISEGLMTLIASDANGPEVQMSSNLAAGVFGDTVRLNGVLNPATISKNQLISQAIPKAGGNIVTTTGSTTATISGNSFGLASATSSNDTNGTITVVMDNAMTDTDFFVQCTQTDAAAAGVSMVFSVNTLSSASFLITCWTSSTSTEVVLSAVSARLNVFVFGEQA